jgi:type II secretory pathway predicted ATPase ExeA
VRGDVLVKVSHHPTPTLTTRIGWLELARGLSLRQAYRYVARDVQDMAQHIADRAEELAKTTLEYLRALKRKEVAVRYPEAIILEGMPWFKDEPADEEVL